MDVGIQFSYVVYLKVKKEYMSFCVYGKIIKDEGFYLLCVDVLCILK